MMDTNFLRFWGEYLLQAAEGQAQMDALVRWLRSGCSPGDELADLFRSCYRLPATATADNAQWRNATRQFKSALAAYAPLWGWVPLERYDRLKKEHATCQRKISQQARQIRQLEALLSERGMGHAALMSRFNNLLDDQTQAFDQLMQAMTAVSEGSKTSDS